MKREKPHRVSVYNKKTKRYKLRKHRSDAGSHRKNPARSDKHLRRIMARNVLDAICAHELSTALQNLPTEQQLGSARLFRLFTEFLADANKRQKKLKPKRKDDAE